MTQTTIAGNVSQSSLLQLHIADCMWGPASDRTDGEDRVDELQSYFAYYKLQIKQSSLVPNGLQQGHEQIHPFIQILKEHPELERRQLRAICETAMQGEANTHHIQTQDIEHWLALAAETLLCINCRLGSEALVFGQSTLSWEEDQSLVSLIESVFPEHRIRSEDPVINIKQNKLRARYLENYADVNIEWTSNLADHLWLDIRDTGKTLHIFELVCYLEASYGACKDAPLLLSSSESLRRGCYHPELLSELLKTYQLLFPVQDEPYLGQKVRQEKRDKSLCNGFTTHHKRRFDSWPLTNRRELFERYPRWAVRLLILYEEADDPTPISWLDRFSERRKAARHTYFLTYLALVVALLLGVVTVGLGAVKIWISYCDWKGDIGGICGSSTVDNALSTSSNLQASSVTANRPFHFTA